MTADGVINIDFNMPTDKLKSDLEKVKQLFEDIDKGAGDNLDNNFKKNADKVKATAETSAEELKAMFSSKQLFNSVGVNLEESFDKGAEKVKSEAKTTSEKVQSEFKQPINQKIKGDAEQLEAEAERAKKSTKSIPKEVKTALIADAKNAGIDNFEKLLKKLPKKQQTELLAKVEKGEAIDYEQLLRKIPAKLVTEAKFNDHATTGLKHLQEEAGSTEYRFSRLKDVIAGSFIGGLATQGIQAITSGLKSATEAGMEYNKEQDTMRTVWTALTTEAPKDGQELLKYINDLSQHSIYSADAINKMSQSFYHVHSNVDETKRWTDSFVALGSTLHMTNDEISESGEMFAKIVAGGKASSEDMAVMINRFPMFGEALQEATGKSMKELYAMSAAGKLTAEQFTETIDFLGKKYKDGTAEAMTSFQGMSMYISSRWSKLWGDVTATSFNMSKKATKDIQGLLSDDMMQKYAQGISNSLAAMTGWVTKLLSYIDSHKNTIVNIIGNGKTILGIIGSTVWNTFIDVVTDIAEALGLTSKNSKDLKDPLEKIDAILDGIVKHKTEVEDFTKAFLLMFGVKKVLEMVGALKSYKDVLGDVLHMSPKQAPLSGQLPVKGATPAAAPTTLPEPAFNSSKWSLLGSSLGARIINGAGLAITAWDVGSSISKALNSNSANVKYSAGAKTVGTLLGGAIGGVLAGPGGAMIGAGIGDQLGSSKTAQNAVEKFVKNFNQALYGKKVNAPEMSKKSAHEKLLAEQKKYYKEKQKQELDDLQTLYKTGNLTDAEYANRVKSVKEHYSKLSKEIRNSKENQSAVDKYYAKQEQALETSNNKAKKKIHNKYDADIEDLKRKGATNTTKYKKLVHDRDLALEKQHSKNKKAVYDLNEKYATTDMTKEAKAHTTLTGRIGLESTKQEKILTNLTNKKGKLSQKQLKTAVDNSEKEFKNVEKLADQQFKAVEKSANKQYKAVVAAADRQLKESTKAADKQYDDTVKAANNQYKGNSKWAKEQRAAVADSAGKQRDETIKSANDQHDKVTTKALRQYNEVTDKAAKQHDDVIDKAGKQRDAVADAAHKQGYKVSTASVKQANNSMSANAAQGKGTQDIWDNITGFFNHILKFLHSDSDPIKAQHNKFSYQPAEMHGGFATGGVMTGSGKALVGEAGPELRYKPYSNAVDILGANGPQVVDVLPGEHILNATDTSKVFAGNYGQSLPGYAKGTSSLSDFMGKIAGSASDVWDNVTDKASDFISKITHPKDELKKIATNTFNLDGVADLGEIYKDASKGMVNKSIDSIADKITKIRDSLAKSESENGGGSSGAPSGKGVQRWKKQLKKALKANGVSTNSAMVNAWLRQIATESGGNEKAVQGNIGDINNKTGDLAKGLLQTISSTFNANKFPGHGNIFNGYDNMLAAIRYAKSRYGSNMLSVIGSGHGYDNGGHLFNKELAWVAETGDEWIINNRKGNADELLSGAINDRANKQPDSLMGRAMQVVQTANMSNGTMLQPVIGGHSNNSAPNGRNINDDGNRSDQNLVVNVDLDSTTIATKTYPIWKVLQAGQITIATNGGAIQ
ncbi:tape measure protein [Latilactobacillus sakei]